MVRYRSRHPPETELWERLRSLANDRRRFGYRRLFIMLRREGEPSGNNRIYRLYREEGLGVRKRKGGKRVDPPPLKWSDLKYVFRHQGGLDHAKEETHTGRDHREAATG